MNLHIRELQKFKTRRRVVRTSERFCSKTVQKPCQNRSNTRVFEHLDFAFFEPIVRPLHMNRRRFLKCSNYDTKTHFFTFGSANSKSVGWDTPLESFWIEIDIDFRGHLSPLLTMKKCPLFGVFWTPFLMLFLDLKKPPFLSRKACLF